MLSLCLKIPKIATISMYKTRGFGLKKSIAKTGKEPAAMIDARETNRDILKTNTQIKNAHRTIFGANIIITPVALIKTWKLCRAIWLKAQRLTSVTFK